MERDTKKPLWVCPECGAKLVSRNLSHACGDYSVEELLAGKSERARSLFEAFDALVRSCGPIELAPAKTRVAFMVRMRFASVNAISDRGLRAHVVLARERKSRRFTKIEKIGGVWVHHFRVETVEELDEEVRSWLTEAYAVGEQKHLA